MTVLWRFYGFVAFSAQVAILPGPEVVLRIVRAPVDGAPGNDDDDDHDDDNVHGNENDRQPTTDDRQRTTDDRRPTTDDRGLTTDRRLTTTRPTMTTRTAAAQ